MATSHVASLAALPEAEIVAMADVDPGAVDRVPENAAKEMSRRELDGEAPKPVGYTDYTTMLDREKPDAVYVVVPPAVRGEVELDLVRRGLSILVEKPLALQLPIAGRILKEIKEREVIAGSGYLYRYASWARRAKELIGDRTIGQVTGNRFARYRPQTDWYNLMSTGGGQLTETATHQVDLLLHLAGGVKTVFATGGSRRAGEWGEDDIFDVQSVVFLFESGAVGGFTCNLLSPHRHRWQVRVDCEGFSLRFGEGNVINVAADQGETEEPMEGDPLLEESRGFVSAVAQGRPELVLSSYESGVRTLAVTLAADRSERSGQTVDVPTLMRDEAGLE
jgi:predicted dehydrogenase